MVVFTRCFTGEGSIGTNEKVFIEILASRNWLHVQEVANQYDAAYGSLETAIITEFNNVDAENALCTIGKIFYYFYNYMPYSLVY